MAVITESEIQEMQRESEARLRAGELAAAIDIQNRLVERLMEPGPSAVQADPRLAQALEHASNQLVDSLRWNRDYPRAIALQDLLVVYLPELEDGLRLSAANLRVEAGDAEAGLAQIHAQAEAEPDNYWYQISLSGALMYLERFAEAEQVLRKAADMPLVRKIDRAMAQEYLFGLYVRMGKTSEALAAWREAGRLESTLRAELMPEVSRMLVYLRKADEARKHINQDPVAVRRKYYQGLAAFGENKIQEARDLWMAVISDYDPLTLKAGHEEYAEACLRMGNPGGAALALEGRVNSGEASTDRMILLGLAHAQAGNLERARFNLDVAMRMADLERPRKTYAAPQGRVLHLFAGLLFAAIPMNLGMRKEIVGYFIPEVEVPPAEPTEE